MERTTWVCIAALSVMVLFALVDWLRKRLGDRKPAVPERPRLVVEEEPRASVPTCLACSSPATHAAPVLNRSRTSDARRDNHAAAPEYGRRVNVERWWHLRDASDPPAYCSGCAAVADAEQDHFVFKARERAADLNRTIAQEAAGYEGGQLAARVRQVLDEQKRATRIKTNGAGGASTYAQS